MVKYKSCRCNNPNHGKWCICVDGIQNIALGIFGTEDLANEKVSELLRSIQMCVDWIDEQLGQNVRSEPRRLYAGRIRYVTYLHLIQRTGHVNGKDSFVIHHIADLALSQAPNVDDQLEVAIDKDGHTTAKLREGIQR